MSILVKPSTALSKSVRLTTLTAVLVARAIEKLVDVKVEIKWVNDLFINGKKVSGILTESTNNLNKNSLDYAIIGIGINVYGNKFNKHIKNIATSIENETFKKIDANRLIALIIDSFNNLDGLIEDGSYINEYRNRLFILNKKITVISGKESYEATAINVNEDGALIISANNEVKTINSGEVSIRI